MEQRIRRALRYSRWLPTATDEGIMWLGWLVRLRWVAILAQATTLSFAIQLIDTPTIVLPLLVGVIATLVVANLYASRVVAADEVVAEGQLLLQLALDVCALTCFFLLAGGPDNTFTPLYLVHIAMAGVMLSPARASILTALVAGCYAMLFAFHLPLHFERHTLDTFTLLRLGQLISFIVTAGSVGLFTLGLARSLRRRKQQLLEARDRTARTDRLRSVGTLAAGAAHELNTPLSTIGLRLRRIGRRHDDPDTQRDAQVIREQLERCNRVVNQLLVGAGDPSAAGLERRQLADLITEGVNLWTKGATLEVRVVDESDALAVEVPRIAFVQALINLLENAREAQAAVSCFEPIEILVERDNEMGLVRVSDRGCGLPDVPDQVGEPFFTTKVHGTGLGVFVARQVADGAGGGLRYENVPGGGTTAVWSFPVARRSVNRRA